MIELDVDMGYLLEDGEPDCVTLNDENGEFEPMTFHRDGADAVAFCKRVESAVKERKPLELFGVNYEAVGDEPFCETVTRWLNGDAPQECLECPDGKYGELTAMVGGGKLTADDVRDLIEHHSDEVGGNGRDFHNGAYEAIADELNATFSHGWCEFKPLPGEDMGEPNAVRGVCSECSALMYGKDNFCPNCGRRVKGGAE